MHADVSMYHGAGFDAGMLAMARAEAAVIGLTTRRQRPDGPERLDYWAGTRLFCTTVLRL